MAALVIVLLFPHFSQHLYICICSIIMRPLLPYKLSWLPQMKIYTLWKILLFLFLQNIEYCTIKAMLRALEFPFYLTFFFITFIFTLWYFTKKRAFQKEQRKNKVSIIFHIFLKPKPYSTHFVHKNWSTSNRTRRTRCLHLAISFNYQNIFFIKYDR